MAEGLEPHHHIIRRAGPAINKHIDSIITDKALLSGLVTKGCISEKDKERYLTGKKKRMKDAFIARFQNQPYETFLKFVYCLREDIKYEELVETLEKGLSEYGYVPPTTVTGSHDHETADTTPAQEQPLLTPPTTVTGSHDHETADTTPTQEQPSLTTTDTTPSVTESPSSHDVSTGNITSSLDGASNRDVIPSDLAVADTTIGPTSPCDVPTPISVVTTDDGVGGEAPGSRQKLQRQDALEVDEPLVVTDEPVKVTEDHITVSLDRLSIATKEEDFPRFPFEGDRETMTFTSEGGELFSFIHKFRIVVPPNAVPPGNYATLHVTGYSHGPFQLPDNCKPCSDFIFVEMEGIDSFQLPATVEISHNLIMDNYTKCHEVLICCCEYNGSFIFSNLSQQYPIIFKKITEPEVSNADNVFLFKLKKFCGLCAIYENDRSYEYPFLKNRSDHHPLQCSQSGDCSLHHCQSGEHPLHHSQSGSTEVRNHPSFSKQASCETTEVRRDSPLTGASRKRKMEDSYSAGSQEKQMCRLEYVMLCYWPVPTAKGVLSVIIFVCKNCPTSIATCKKQVAVLSESFHLLKPIEKYYFKFDESRRITVDVEVTATDPTGWDIHKDVTEVHEDEFREDDVLQTWRDGDSQSLRDRVKHFQYPPRIKLEISYNGTRPAVSDPFQFTLHFSGIQETMYSKDSDKKISLSTSQFNMFPPSLDSSMITFNFSSHPITTRLLVQVAMKMTQFECIARYLGFDNNDIIRLQEEYDSRAERCYRMLQEWQDNLSKQSDIQSLEELHRALCFTDQESCLPKVLERDDHYKNVNIEYLSSTTGISEELLNSRVSDSIDSKLFTGVAQRLPSTWQHVGRLLGLSDDEVEEIWYDYKKHGITEVAYRMLRKWVDKNGSSALVSQLIVALLIVRQSSIITYLRNSTQCNCLYNKYS